VEVHDVSQASLWVAHCSQLTVEQAKDWGSRTFQDALKQNCGKP